MNTLEYFISILDFLSFHPSYNIDKGGIHSILLLLQMDNGLVLLGKGSFTVLINFIKYLSFDLYYLFFKGEFGLYPYL